MQTRRLGTTDLELTRVGFGAWAIGGGGWKHGWGASDDQESIATIHRALDLGVNWIDTAPVYGVGHSEEVVGRALKGRADRPYVFTKCGLLGNRESDNVVNTLEPDSIRREVDESLRRLGIDVIDLYQIHWPDPDPQIEDAWATMVDLRDAGKVRHLGVSNFDAGQLERVAAIAPVESLQPHYSIIHREVEESVLPWALDHGTGVIAYSPMESGLLTGKMTRERIDSLPDDDWRRNNPDYQEPAVSEHLALVERMAAVGERHGVTPGAVAMAGVLRHPAVTGAIVGARRPDQLDDTVVAADLVLDDDDLATLGVEDAAAAPTGD